MSNRWRFQNKVQLHLNFFLHSKLIGSQEITILKLNCVEAEQSTGFSIANRYLLA